MFCINVVLTVKDEHAGEINEIRSLLGEAGRLSRAEPGCLSFEVCHSRENPKLFMLCERWESEQAWKDHKQRRAVQEIYLPQVLPRVERVPHFCDLVE